METNVIIKSLSDPSIEYEIDLSDLTCTCQYFLGKSYRYSHSDPNRLCKHLVQTLAMQGIPEHLAPHGDQILWCAARGVRFMPPRVAAKKIKDPLPPGSIETVSAKKKVKYLYLAGCADGKTIAATITLADGDTAFQINGYWGFYNPQSSKCTLPKAYEFMKDALMHWIGHEYAKATNREGA